MPANKFLYREAIEMFATMCLFHEIFMKSRTEGAAFCMTLDARLSLSLSARPLVLCATFIYFSFSESCSDRGEREREKERERKGDGGARGQASSRGRTAASTTGATRTALCTGKVRGNCWAGRRGGCECVIKCLCFCMARAVDCPPTHFPYSPHPPNRKGKCRIVRL